jgi:hypothetical protein
MKRKCAWLAMCVAMLSGADVLAQEGMQTPYRYGNPGMYGYPVLPQPPRPPVPPTPPYPPFPPSYMPNLPYTNPYSSPGPAEPRAAEPYLVMPESLPPSGPPSDSKPRNIVTEPFVPFSAPSSDGEPYTVYEGQRYLAEMKEDNRRVWAQANFIHWWVRRDSTPPLITTGNPANPAVGTIGNPDTGILLGNGAIGPKEFSGIQATLGIWLDPERLVSLEVGGFWLGKNSRQYRFASDANGNPPLGQPVIVGGTERSLLFAQPGNIAGRLAVDTLMDFHSLELNRARNLLRFNGWSLDTLVGIRYLYLNDSLSLNQSITVLPGGAGLPFAGAATPAGSNFRLSDSFDMTNRFYGGTIGARVNWTWRQLDLGAVLKVSLGAAAHVAVINGATTLNAIDGSSNTLSGGSLAQASNIGRTTSTDFSVVPEVTVTAGYQIAPHLRILVGYTALDWNRIERAGNQIDRQIDRTQAPTSPLFVPGAVGVRPVFPATRTDFWAQGINVGLELKF